MAIQHYLANNNVIDLRFLRDAIVAQRLLTPCSVIWFLESHLLKRYLLPIKAQCQAAHILKFF